MKHAQHVQNQCNSFRLIHTQPCKNIHTEHPRNHQTGPQATATNPGNTRQTFAMQLHLLPHSEREGSEDRETGESTFNASTKSK